MNKGKIIKQRKSHRGSLIWAMLNSFTAFLYSLFIFGRVGEHLSSRNTYCKRSLLAHSFSGTKTEAHTEWHLLFAAAFQKNGIVRFLSRIGRLVSCLKVNIYGTFFAIYGITAGLVCYITTLINGQSVFEDGNLQFIATSAAISICAIPLLFSGQSATKAIAKSRVMRRVALDFLDIPEEKLEGDVQYGGKQYALVAVISAIVCGTLTYLFGVWYMIIATLAIIGLYLVFSSPEVGVILTIAAIPFLQYGSVTKTGVVIMILVTSLAYGVKLIQRRRAMTLSPELVMALLFCGFTFAASLFTAGGAQVTWDAISQIIIIVGGLFLTSNLITSRKRIDICAKTLTSVLVVCAVIGIWDGFYHGISHRISDRVGEQLFDISSMDVMAVLEGGTVFGIMAVLAFPMLFAYAAKQKSVKGIAAMIIASLITFVACWLCSRYEIVVALIIECVLFWLLYSHRSLAVMIIAAIPISIAAILYPYAIQHLGWPNFTAILAEYMPTGLYSTAINTEASMAMLEMFFGGNILGIGAGQGALEAVLPQFSELVSASEAYGSSLWMNVLCSSGIFGFAAFLIFIGFLIRRSFGCFSASDRDENQSLGIALLCSVCVALMLGMITNVWANGGMMYLFWVNVGLLIAHIRVLDSERARRSASFADSVQSADTEVKFYK